MMVLVSYDVNTQTTEGRARLRRVAKLCEDVGQRVQNSVFECKLDSTQLLALKSKLLRVADHEKDSLRFYNLGNKWQGRVEHFGAKVAYDPEGPMIL